jgi:hypothetical protein
VKIGKSASETLALLTVVYGEYTMKKLSVFEWHRRFKEGREAVQEWQPKTQKTEANVSRVRTLVGSDQRLGLRVIAEELNMNRETVRQIVKEDLGMRKISVKMVPRILTHDQKHQLHISSDLSCNEEMFDRVITGDETWCFQYEPETKLCHVCLEPWTTGPCSINLFAPLPPLHSSPTRDLKLIL